MPRCRQAYAQPSVNIKTRTARSATGLRCSRRGRMAADFGAADRGQGDSNAPSPSLCSPRRHSGRAAAVQRRSRRSTRRASASTCATWRRPRGCPPSPSTRIRPRSPPAASTSSGACSTSPQDEIGDRLPIVNGIWADGSLEAARIARMAAEGGASALLVFPPAPFTLRPDRRRWRSRISSASPTPPTCRSSRSSIRSRPARAIRATRC